MDLQPQHFTQAKWRGQTLDFALAFRDRHIYFWEVSPPNIECSFDKRLFVLDESIHASNKAILNWPLLERIFQREWERGLDGETTRMRLLAFEDLTVLLAPDGRGQLNAQGAFAAPVAADGTEFRFESTPDVFEWSSARWQENLQRWSAISENDFAFARAWLRLPPRDQGRLLITLSHGSWNEVEQIAYWLLEVESDLTPSPLPLKRTHLYTQLKLFWEQDRWQVQLQSKDAYMLRTLWESWFSFCAPSPNLNLLDHHIAASNSARQNAGLLFQLRHKERTIHEQLETRLQLRDWFVDRAGIPSDCVAEPLG